MSDVDTVHGANGPATDGPVETRDPVPAAVDWLLGALSGLFGLALLAVGAGLFARVDRALITDVTPEQFVTAAAAATDWIAAGIVVTGLGLVGAAAVFVRARRRTRARVDREGGTTATFWACSVYGAVATALLSFVPGSVVVGGAVAAYLHGDSETRTGAATGLVANALTVPLLAFFAVGTLAGANAVGMLAGGGLLALLLVAAGLVALAVNAALGALGGLAVDRLV